MEFLYKRVVCSVRPKKETKGIETLAALAAAVIVSVEPIGLLLRGALDQHNPPAREGHASPAPRHCNSAACS